MGGRRLDFWVTGWGTGGTLTGAGEVIKAARPEVRVVATEPAGASLHLFLAPGRTSPESLRQMLGSEAEFRAIVPSLEDVFIALVRKSEEPVHA